MFPSQAAINKKAREIEQKAKDYVNIRPEIANKILNLRNNIEDLFDFCVQEVSTDNGHLIISFIRNHLMCNLRVRAQI
jgi:uncharacterized coiled-coil DUF342 family protein